MAFLILNLFFMVICFLYDVSRALRRKTGYNAFISVIGDFVFWIFSISLIACVLYNIYSFNLRLYHFCVIFIGCGIYFITLSDFFIFLINGVLNIFEFFFKIVFTILKFCGKILKKCLLFLTAPIRWAIRNLIKLFKIMKLNVRKHLHIIKRI